MGAQSPRWRDVHAVLPSAMERPPTHLLFDFFGTLVHYNDSWTGQGFRGTHRLAREAGIELGHAEFLDAWGRAAGALEAQANATLEEYRFHRTVEAFLAPFARGDDGELVEALCASYLQEWSSDVRGIEGLHDMLLRLAERFQLGVITNTSDATLVRELMQELELSHCFELVVTSVEHGRRKPCATIFHSAVERLDASPERCLYVGDSPVPDYFGARDAGLSAWLIDPTHRADIPHQHRLESILDVERRLG